MEVKNWRGYERHPISARYADIKAAAWEDFLENFGPDRPTLTLFDGMILDGWQRYRACLEKGIEPLFKVLREGTDPEAYVETHNEHRRHEDAAAMCKRREKRQERVAKLREQGKSVRTIAKEVGVAKNTVEKDLKSQLSYSRTPEKVKGKDGKEYKSTKAKPLCEACQTKKRKSQELPAKCPDCKSIRSTKKRDKGNNPDADMPEKDEKVKPMDDLGNELPKGLRNAFAGNRDGVKNSIKLIQEVYRMCRGLTKWNPYLRAGELEGKLDQIVEDLKNGLPHAVCESCQGKNCKACRNSGWLPKWAVK